MLDKGKDKVNFYTIQQFLDS